MILFHPTPNLDWSSYGKDAGGTRFVSGSSITKKNVSSLQKAWEFHTGDVSDLKNKPSSAFECTPLFVDQSLFVVTPFNRVFALDPDTGNPRWTFDPKLKLERPYAVEPFACRGLATWRNEDSGARSIFLATYDGRLLSINSKSGHLQAGFGDHGQIDLRADVGGKEYLDHYVETSAPTVIGDKIVLGSSIGDNFSVHMPSGMVRAYDVRTGHLIWSWEPLQHSEQAGAGNAWSTLSADPARDLVFVPTGSPSPDFCGITRPGDDADADSVVALNASTGKKVWSFQLVKHDLWDYDAPAQPILADIGGKPAVVVMTKMGHVFVLDRLTGKPLLPVEERPVPASDIPGETAAETQVFPVAPKPLVPDRFEPWAFTDANKKFIQTKLKGLRMEGIFTPPSQTGTLIFPGDLGGCNWSGGSFSPLSNTLFVNTNSLATVVYLIPNRDLEKSKSEYAGHEIADQSGAPYGVRREWLYIPGLVPANKPPWGMLHAIDLTTGGLRWEKPLGILPQYQDIDAAKDWGSPNLGGSFVTDTGLLFIAATIDPKIRAFDTGTGAILWEATLPAGGQAAPMTYRSARTGKEYVVQCAGGHHGLGSPEGDSVVAFAIP